MLITKDTRDMVNRQDYKCIMDRNCGCFADPVTCAGVCAVAAFFTLCWLIWVGISLVSGGPVLEYSTECSLARLTIWHFKVF